MVVAVRLRRLVASIAAVAVLTTGALPVWAAASSAGEAQDPCRAMRAMAERMPDCERAALMACCRDDHSQPESAPPQAPISIAAPGADFTQPLWLAPGPETPRLHTGSAWYARPPTHGYSSQTLHLLQSVILI